MKKTLLFVFAAGIVATQDATAQWQLNGNAGTTPASQFIGTTDSVGFRIRTNNQVRVGVTADGKVGIGTASPSYALDVKSDDNCTVRLKSQVSGSSNMVIDRATGTDNCLVNYKTGGADNWRTGCAGNSNFVLKNPALASDAMTVLSANNNVGIGVASPANKLEVGGDIAATGTVKDGSGNSTEWNQAYSWGNHAAAGYLTTETDPQVGANALNYASKWDGSALVTSNIYSSGTFAGVNATSAIGSAQFVVGSTSASYYGMYVNSTGTAGSRLPFYGYAAGGGSSCWTYWEESTGNWKVYNGGDRLTVESTGQVGIGTNLPAYYLDIQAAAAYRALNATSNYVGSIGQVINFERTSVPSGANDILQITVPSGSPSDFQFIECDKASSNRFQVNGDGSTGIGQSTLSTARLNVDGSNVENKKLYGIYSTTDSVSSSSVGIYGIHELVGSNVDAKGVYGKCVANPGYGYGLYGEGGYRGVYGFGNGSTYTGTVVGVYGTASGSTAGTRIGIYGTASGGSSAEANWGGYFPTKVYATQIRVGTTAGATGYIACIGGKLIAEEVRVELEASWPDYVFASDYKMLSLDELEEFVNEYNHLPGVPSACEIEENGLHLGEMSGVIMEKTEENTLYILQLKKENQTLKSQLEKLQQQVNELMKK